MGVVLVDMFPAEKGKTLDQVTAFIPKPGGAPANIAVALARQGFPSAFIGKVGKDPFGKLLINILKNEGVNTVGVIEDPSIKTTIAFIAQPDPYHSEFVFYRFTGSGRSNSLNTARRKLISSCAVFHFDSPGLSETQSREGISASLELAGNSGAIISFDINYRPNLWDDPNQAVEWIEKYLPRADVVKLNEVELKLLTGSDDPIIGAPSLLSRGPKLVIVTLGENGSWYFTKSVQGFVPPFRVETEDATGCGDAFLSGILGKIVESQVPLYDLLSWEVLNEILTYASAVGAITATKVGAIPALPDADTIQAFLESRSGKDRG